MDRRTNLPVILRIRGYRFWFYEADLDEPPHVYVGKEGKEAKFWIEPIRLARVRGFRDFELGEIERILIEYTDDFKLAWEKEKMKRGHG